MCSIRYVDFVNDNSRSNTSTTNGTNGSVSDLKKARVNSSHPLRDMSNNGIENTTPTH